MKTMPASLEPTDPELLALARGGDQAAYGQLVSRHQTLVASLAYSICGDFARSQDVAQEAFVTAWQQLATLQDATKFKSWLCGITRNLGHNFIRRQTRRADQPAISPETAPEPATDSPTPREQAVTREESAIVWRALGQLPENYREPLILFYREHHSIERVAAALDLSEDTVKQRLSRGRAMLRDQVESLVDRSLGFTTPGVAFTTAVLSALPVATMQMAAVSAATAAAKGGTAAKAVVSLSGFSVVAAPLVQLAAIVVGRRESLRFATSTGEQKFIKRLWAATATLGLLASVAILVRISWLRSNPGSESRIFLWVPLLILVGWIILGLWAWRPFIVWGRNVRLPENASPLRKRFWFGPDRARAYRSQLTLLGLPLLDIRFGHSPQEPLVRGTACGWIAIGDIAHGVVFALGGAAVGGIAIGGLAIGGLAIGGATLGLAAFGALAGGWVAGGMIAVGYVATAVLAFGFKAAVGGVAVAFHFAQGPIFAAANHANDPAVRHWIEVNPFMRLLSTHQYLVMFCSIVLLPQLSGVVTNFLVRRPQSPRRSRS